MSLQNRINEIRACQLCAEDLPLGPRPVIQVSEHAKILIAGQAPGTKVHASGVPFDDPSGDRLRRWMGVTKAQFYDKSRVSIIPMGFCYPGRHPGGRGDAPPHPRCAKTWHDGLFALLPGLRLKLVIGQYAIAYHCPELRKLSVADAARHALDSGYRDGTIVLPHPSPRNQMWFKRHPWFEDQVVPEVQRAVKDLI